MQTIRRISLALIIIGALNWGLIGLFQWDLIAAVFGGQTATLSRIVYTLMGIGGIFYLPFLLSTMNVENYDYNRAPTENMNYATEFGDENDPFRDRD